MIRIAWRMLIHRPLRLFATWGGLAILFLLAAIQIGLLVGWCHTVSAIVRHSNADLWIMAEKTTAFDYGSGIPRQRIYQARSVEGVSWAEGMYVAWTTWQRSDGERVRLELVGLDTECAGGPWIMREGSTDSVHLPDGVIVDELFLKRLGVNQLGDEAEILGNRAVVRGISREVRSFTSVPLVFTSIDAARRYDRRNAPDEITYVLIRCAPDCSIEVVRDRLRQELPHVEVLTRREFAIRTIRYWMLDTGAGVSVIFAAVLGIVVSAVVTGQMLFAVTQEYLPNYATLGAVGFDRTRLLACLLIQGLILGGGEVMFGSAGFAVAVQLSPRSNLAIQTTPAVYGGLVLVALASCMFGGLLSVRALLRLDPATVFRG
jgi:putative ABC transport system permease protein